MSVVSHKLDDKVVIKIQGEFDEKVCTAFREEILQLISDGINDVTVNLSEVDFIDSPGLGILISAAFKLQNTGGSFIIENPQFHIVDLFEATQTSKYLKVKD